MLSTLHVMSHFIHRFNKYLLNVPGSALRTADTAVNKTDTVPPFLELKVGGDNQQICNIKGIHSLKKSKAG